MSTYYSRNRRVRKEYQRLYYLRTKHILNPKRKEYGAKYRQAHREQIAAKYYAKRAEMATQYNLKRALENQLKEIARKESIVFEVDFDN